jgi:hypothetical protein
VRRNNVVILRVAILAISCASLVMALAPAAGASSTSTTPPPLKFEEAAPQGFGDRQNSGAWSMQWWNGKLYVGTVRSWLCWSKAWFHLQDPIFPWPPLDPDLDCATDPLDLPLQAEIWRYTPEADLWERVYQSPNDVEIPGYPGHYTARDIGYRDMIVYQEPDGKKALYVAGVTAGSLWQQMPPPRILRSVDGTHFAPVPQDPGTLLGDLGFNQGIFRDLATFKGRLYILNGQTRGEGSILESADPARGNDSFRWITPQDMKVFEFAAFNGYLYIGVVGQFSGFKILKTDAEGDLPYTFTTVISDGGYVKPIPSNSVVSMFVYDDALYVGTNQPSTDLLRINPDDTWDVIVGDPRETPDGWKYPLSGISSGFNWPLNVHMWRMQDHDGVLYVGTLDQSTRFRYIPVIADNMRWQFGFDLWSTADGYHFRPITVNGFGDMYQMGLRSLQSTPYGLFAGTVSYWYGLRVWQGVPGTWHTVFLPLIEKSPAGVASGSSYTSLAASSATLSPLSSSGYRATPASPERLEVEAQGDRVILSWEVPPGVVQFRIMRSDFVPNAEVGIPDLEPEAWIPGRFQEVGSTRGDYFVDTTIQPGRPYQYYVVAENAAGQVSVPSNLVRAPSLAPAVTFGSLCQKVAGWKARAAENSADSIDCTNPDRIQASKALADRVPDQPLTPDLVLRMAAGPKAATGLQPWRARDVAVLAGQLARRVKLAEEGLIDFEDLFVAEPVSVPGTVR